MTASIRKLFLITLLHFIVATTAFGNKTGESTPRIVTPKMDIVFTTDGDLRSITSTYTIKNNQKNAFFSISDNQAIDSCFRSISIQHSQTENDSTINITFVSADSLNHVSLQKSYTIYKKSYIIDFSLIMSGDSVKKFSSTGMINFSLLSNCKQEDCFHFLTIGNHSHSKQLKSGELTDYKICGLRNRFWAILIRPIDAIVPAHYDSALTFRPDFTSTDHYTFRIYSGPVVYNELHKAGKDATTLLYPLWFWMRWLSFGLMCIFDFLLNTTGNTVISILLLSICMKIVIAPLYKIASNWQRKVNEQKSLIQPRLDEINREYKGEEKTRLTLALYKELGISPLYSLKSLLSAAIQIPIFFAAYHMLSEHIALNNVSFLWINDLSLPDHIAKLPITIPFVGGYLNILPFVMTSITFAASWLHSDASLSSALQKKQQNNLYIMAGLFFVLLYTSPAGMVIYWTMNNALAFFSTLWESWFNKRKIKKSTT